MSSHTLYGGRYEFDSNTLTVRSSHTHSPLKEVFRGEYSGYMLVKQTGHRPLFHSLDYLLEMTGNKKKDVVDVSSPASTSSRYVIWEFVGEDLNVQPTALFYNTLDAAKYAAEKKLNSSPAKKVVVLEIVATATKNGIVWE